MMRSKEMTRDEYDLKTLEDMGKTGKLDDVGRLDLEVRYWEIIDQNKVLRKNAKCEVGLDAKLEEVKNLNEDKHALAKDKKAFVHEINQLEGDKKKFHDDKFSHGTLSSAFSRNIDFVIEEIGYTILEKEYAIYELISNGDECTVTGYDLELEATELCSIRFNTSLIEQAINILTRYQIPVNVIFDKEEQFDDDDVTYSQIKEMIKQEEVA